MTKHSPKKPAPTMNPGRPAIPPPATTSGSKNKRVQQKGNRSKTTLPPETHVPPARRGTPRKGGSKIDTVIQLMQSKGGASIEQLVKATGWQAHSVRGAISGALKKKLGLKVLSERINEVRIYRIAK